MSAYDKAMLPDAMQNMGEMLEYSSRGCRMDPARYLKIFSYSSISDEWGRGNPVYICGRSGTELCMDVLDKAGCHYIPSDIGLLEMGDLYWSGWILARYQWHTGERFQDICQSIDLNDILCLYPAGHTASEDRACALIDDIRQEHSRILFAEARSRLQAYRKRIGMSQSELARASGVNLRTLQEYEVGRKDLSQAAAGKVIRLAEILRVNPADLL